MTARRTVAAALVVLAPLAGACSSGSGAPHGSSTATVAAAATRHWWHGGVDYCDLLRQTLRAGRSVLPGVGAGDPARLTTTKAFLAAVEKAAPAGVAGSWHTLGAAAEALVSARGHAARVHGIDARTVSRAARAVAVDAQHNCGLRLGAH